MNSAISFDEVGVRYRLWRRNRKSHALRSRGTPAKRIWGIRGISFNIAPGEFLGLVGRNGAGKTTLLLTAAGILRPDEGEIRVVGRPAPVLGVGTGIVPGLTGWDNIELISVLVGLSPREARAVAPDVGEFSGLKDFLDAPVRTYSSGMRARLGFAVIAHCGADILLLDEVAAVGDEEFRRRSADRLAELRAQGSTIVLASHDLPTLEESADRIAWLDGGTLVEIGKPTSVVGHYAAAVGSEKESPKSRGRRSIAG